MNYGELIEVDWKQPDWKVTVLTAARRRSSMVMTSPSAEVRKQAEELIRSAGLHPDSKASLPFYWIASVEESGVERMYFSYNGSEPYRGRFATNTPVVPVFSD